MWPIKFKSHTHELKGSQFLILTNAGNLASTFSLPCWSIYKSDMTNHEKLWNTFFAFKQNIFSFPLSHSLLQRDLSWPQLLPTTNSNPQNPISLYMCSDNNPASHTLRPWLHYKDPMDPPPESLTLKKAASLVFFLSFFLPVYPILPLSCASCCAEGMAFWSALRSNWTKM